MAHTDSPAELSPLLTVVEVAGILNKSESQIRWMIHRQSAPRSALIGGRRMFRRIDVDAFIEAAFEEVS